VEERLPDPVPDESPRTAARVWVGTLALVLLSLTCSLLAPLLQQRRIGAVRAGIDRSADPGRTLVTGIRFSLAREMAALRGIAASELERIFLEFYRIPSGGDLAAAGEVGRGAVFTLRLPADRRGTAAGPQPAAPSGA
jgi:hypothetical protein